MTQPVLLTTGSFRFKLILQYCTCVAAACRQLWQQVSDFNLHDSFLAPQCFRMVDNPGTGRQPVLAALPLSSGLTSSSMVGSPANSESDSDDLQQGAGYGGQRCFRAKGPAWASEQEVKDTCCQGTSRS